MHRARWLNGLAILGAGLLLTLAPGATLAANVVPAGQQVPLTGISSASQPPQCPTGQFRVAHLILNGLVGNEQTELVGTEVFVTFSDGTNTGFLTTQGAVNDQALVVVPMGSNTATVVSGYFVVPNTLVDQPNGALTYNNFNLSGGECDSTPPTNSDNFPVNTDNAPPNGATPELDSVVLFGVGVAGLAAYALYQRRRRPAQS